MNFNDSELSVGVMAADIHCNEQLYTLAPASLRPGSSDTTSLGSLHTALSELSFAPTAPIMV